MQSLALIMIILVTLLFGACLSPSPTAQVPEPKKAPAPESMPSPKPTIPGPQLVLEPPQIEGMQATINGRATSETTSISKILWLWDDGQMERSWFPASHTYDSAGVYTVTAIAFDDKGGSTVKTATVVIVPQSVPPPKPAPSPEPVPSHQPMYTINAMANPGEGGSVTFSPDQDSYNAGARVTLTATATAGYRFTSWSGDISGANPAMAITMDSNKNVTAHFMPSAKPQFTLITSVNPPGGGQISPSGGEFDAPKVIIINAYPAPGSYFKYWSENGLVLSTSPSMYLTVDRDRNITAHFGGSTDYRLFITLDPPHGGGVIVKSDDGKVITDPDISTWPSGTKVTLIALASSGYRYWRWSGDVFGIGPEVTIAMDSDKRVTIHFVAAEG